jgi:hypothetical protein
VAPVQRQGADTIQSTGLTLEVPLPDGWSIVEYAGKRGKPLYAVYADGRRMASGMTSVQSAIRWARLLALSRSWPFG